MPKKRLGAEQIGTKLRQAEVLQSQDKRVAAACKEAGLAALSGTTSVTGTSDLLGILLERLQKVVDARHHAEALEALPHFLTSHFLHLGDSGNAGKRIDRYGSLIQGVALHSGFNTPSLRLEESNANLTPNFCIDRDIPVYALDAGYRDMAGLTDLVMNMRSAWRDWRQA